jgi:hypothetical protein
MEKDFNNIAVPLNNLNIKKSNVKKSEAISIRFTEIGHKLSNRSAILAIISTIVGGGIVSLPHSIYYTGIILGFILIIMSGL